MKKRVLFALIACAMLSTAVMAQPQRGGRGGFGGFGGFGRPSTPPGPPAPVPEVVAIARPTQAEIDTMNAEIKRFIATNTSASKDLLKKFASMLVVNPPRDNPCVRPTPGVRYNRHDAFVETAKNEQFDVLFHGDSITDWWQQPAEQGGGTDVFAKHFGDMKIANFAVAGDTTQGILWGLQNGEGQGHKPKVIMLMIGTNSAGSSSGAEIAEGVGAVILRMRQDFPDAKILLLAIFPRGGSASDSMRQTNEEANKIITKLEDKKHVFFMNINDKFLNPDGSLVGFRRDNLHPNEEGYEIWANAVKAKLKELLK